jgi:hypothetical protein
MSKDSTKEKSNSSSSTNHNPSGSMNGKFDMYEGYDRENLNYITEMLKSKDGGSAANSSISSNGGRDKSANKRHNRAKSTFNDVASPNQASQKTPIQGNLKGSQNDLIEFTTSNLNNNLGLGLSGGQNSSINSSLNNPNTKQIQNINQNQLQQQQQQHQNQYNPMNINHQMQQPILNSILHHN